MKFDFDCYALNPENREHAHLNREREVKNGEREKMGNKTRFFSPVATFSMTSKLVQSETKVTIQRIERKWSSKSNVNLSNIERNE